MTRIAGRKRRSHAIKEPHRHLLTLRANIPWGKVGALVATAAVGLRPSLASADDLAFNHDDARLAVIDAALRSTNSLLGRPLGRLAYQDQDSPSSTVHRYDIAAGPLGEVVAAFERVSGVHVTLALASIGSIQSPGVSGSYDLEHALQAMITGTGVRFRLTSL